MAAPNHPPQLPRLSLPPTTASSFKRSFEELGFEIDGASPGGSGGSDTQMHMDAAQGQQQNDTGAETSNESEHGHGRGGERVPKRARSASYEGARGWTEASGSGSSRQVVAGPSSERSPGSSSTLSSSSPPHASHSSHASHSTTANVTRTSSTSSGSMGINLSLQLSLIGPPPRLPRLALEEHHPHHRDEGDDVRMSDLEEEDDDDRDELDDPPTLPPILPISDTDTATHGQGQEQEITFLRRGPYLPSGRRRRGWASPSGFRSRSLSPRRSQSPPFGLSSAPVLPPIRLAGEGDASPSDEGEEIEISIGRIARRDNAAIGPSFPTATLSTSTIPTSATPPFRNLLDSALDVLREVPGDTMAGLGMGLGLGPARTMSPATTRTMSSAGPTRTMSPPRRMGVESTRTMSPPRRMGVGAPTFAHRTTPVRSPEPLAGHTNIEIDMDTDPIAVDMDIDVAPDPEAGREMGHDSLEMGRALLAMGQDSLAMGHDSLEMATAQMREAREAIERSEETIASVRALRESEGGEGSGAGLGSQAQHPVASSSSAALPPHSSLFTSSPPVSHSQPLAAAHSLTTAQTSTLGNYPFESTILDDSLRHATTIFHDAGGGSSTADITRAEAEFTGDFRERVASIIRENTGNPEEAVVFDANPGEARGLELLGPGHAQAQQVPPQQVPQPQPPGQTSGDPSDRRQAVIDRLSNRLHTLQETRRRREEELRDEETQTRQRREEETRQRRDEQSRLLRDEETRLMQIGRAHV